MRDWASVWPAICRVHIWCNVNQKLESYQIVPRVKERILVENNLVDDAAPKAIGSGLERF
jgi:hypothetical protein